MTLVTKLSELTTSDIAEYLVLDEVDSEERHTLKNLLMYATSYIKNYTGLTEEKMDTLPELVIACLVLIQDMWDNRTMYVSPDSTNRTVDAILNMHCVNLLPKDEDDG